LRWRINLICGCIVYLPRFHISGLSRLLISSGVCLHIRLNFNSKILRRVDGLLVLLQLLLALATSMGTMFTCTSLAGFTIGHISGIGISLETFGTEYF
jgi:hypothetical protein